MTENPTTGLPGPDHLDPAQIVALRRRLGLTQAQLAQQIGIGAESVNRWERGIRRPSPLALARQDNRRIGTCPDTCNW